MAPQVVRNGRYSTNHDAATCMSLAQVALARRGAEIVTNANSVTATGGSPSKYRLVGSRSRRSSQFMPWRAELLVTPTSAQQCTVALSLVSNQGWYLYQGKPTRAKWERLLDSIRDEVLGALGSTPT
jgi:hypothetical protein